MERTQNSNLFLGYENNSQISQGIFRLDDTSQVLNLSGSNIYGTSGSEFAEQMEINSNYKKINLEYNNLGPEGTKIFIEKLNSVPIYNLIELNISNNNIKNRGLLETSNFLKVNKSIVDLNISYNDIREEGWNTLREILRENNSITNLVLDGNKIDEKHFQNLTELINSKKLIKCLSLENLKIGDRYIYLIENMIKKNFLKKINLSNNDIGILGSIIISKALINDTSLINLNLSLNNIGIEGAIKLFDAIKNNKNIKEFNLTKTNINVTSSSHEFKNKLKELINLNKTLQILNLSYNEMDDAIGSLTAAMKMNYRLIAINLDHSLSLETKTSKLQKYIKRNCEIKSIYENEYNNILNAKDRVINQLNNEYMQTLEVLSKLSEDNSFISQNDFNPRIFSNQESWLDKYSKIYGNSINILDYIELNQSFEASMKIREGAGDILNRKKTFINEVN